MSFVLEGKDGLLSYVQQLLDVQGHAVICVAEGAGQVRPHYKRSFCAAHEIFVTQLRCRPVCIKNALEQAALIHFTNVTSTWTGIRIPKAIKLLLIAHALIIQS